MSGIHCRWTRIPAAEIGDFDHVDHQNYIRWMYEMAREHFANMGVNRDFFKALDQFFVVRRHSVEHISPCFLDDRVLLATWVSEQGSKALKRQHRIYKMDESENLRPVLRAQTLSIFVDKSVTPTSIPAKVSDAIDVVTDRDFDDFIKSVKPPSKL
jgi:acyl-CoA thioester hydrolase